MRAAAARGAPMLRPTLLALLCAHGACFHAAFRGGMMRPRAAAHRARSASRVRMIGVEDVLWTPSWKTGERDAQFGEIGRYCEDLNTVIRRKTRTVEAGPVKFGSEHPIVRQTMGTTNTRDVEGTIDQVMRCADVGFDLVRVTVVGMKEAEACHRIREGLFKKGYDIPLCADMHFQPAVAIKTAEAVEKIRINPGNFADGRKDFDEKIYETDEDFEADREYMLEVFEPLVRKCKELNRAMRIGTNHGSLSSRILSFYGDSPRGMVESAIEFADMCRALDYHNFVFSMKASNPVVMIQGYRLLAAEQYRLGWDYPLHLGVTEAGEGEDGRMKSAIGIGTLLADGLGDTIRVSLTEDPEYEFAPCNRLADLGGEQLRATELQRAVPPYVDARDITSFSRRSGRLPEQREGDDVDFRGLLHRDGSVLSAISLEQLAEPDALQRSLGCKSVLGMPFKDVATSDSLLLRELPPASDKNARRTLKRLAEVSCHAIVPAAELEQNPLPNAVALVELADFAAAAEPGAAPCPPPGVGSRVALTMRGTESDAVLEAFKARADEVDVILLETAPTVSRLHASRRLFTFLLANELETPVVHHLAAPDVDKAELALTLGMQVGALLGDGLGDGVLIEPSADATDFELDYLRETSFALLQGSRMRNTKTEFVSCPSCGRTLFDLQEVTAQISERTGHLPGVAIAIMGCIVNGPGEMADADFGYVGGAPGKVDLYVGKEVVKRNIPNDDACDALVQLIKDNGMWKEKEEDNPEGDVAEPEAAVAA